MGNFNLDVTLKKAVDEFSQKDLKDMADKSGGIFGGEKIALKFFDQQMEITHPEGKVFLHKTGQEAGLIETILVLHYLVKASGRDLTGKNITFKELPGGSIYIDPFTNRCIRPLIGLFGANLEEFSQAAESLGGIKQKFGHVSFCFSAFPRIPVTLVLWAGDEEFPPNANILFDETAPDYLPTEDFAFLCGMLVGQLKAAKIISI